MMLATCIACGCDDMHACAGGCSWLAVDYSQGRGVCSNCSQHLAAWQRSTGSPMLSRGLRSAAELGANKPCGTRLRYLGGCRCAACRRANSLYEGARRRARNSGDWNGIVPAARARAHMLKLRNSGVGRRSFHAATDIADSVLAAIVAGRKKRIRARTERKILAVDLKAAADRAYVPAAPTWRRINELIEEGFTRQFLAKRLGSKAKQPRLQLRKDRVTARHAYDVERLHKALTT